MHYLNIVLFWVFFGFLCSYLARKKARNPTLWFWLGIFLGLIGVIVIACLPKRVPLKKPPVYVAEPAVALPPPENWYYLHSDRTHRGPLSLSDLQKIWKEECLNEATYFWKEGMEKWMRLSDLPDLKKKF